MFGRKALFFTDFDDQEYALFSDEGVPGVGGGEAWHKGPVPDEFAIIGLGPIFFRVNQAQRLLSILTQVMGMREVARLMPYTLVEMGEGGNGASVILEEVTYRQPALQGFGGVHHVAFRIEDETELNQWIQTLNGVKAGHSGLVDRFYFKSLYTRLYPGLLFEFATEGPGFIDDEEPYETLGEILALPPRFRNQRAYVESVVRPIDTVRSTKVFPKETFE